MRRMKMQTTNIGMMLNKHGWDTQKFDLAAQLDRTLTYHENKVNIARMTGINLTGRDRGTDMLLVDSMERARKRQRRSGDRSNLEVDSRYQAMQPGKRKARRSGRRYYEKRENRSDVGFML